jgi:hypothetical protein
LAGLLKRVLGESIEQRRRAIRAALKELDGDAHQSLISADSPFMPGGLEAAEELDAADLSSVSEITDGVVLLSGSELTGSFAGYPAGQSASGLARSEMDDDVPDRRSLIGYVIGVLGLLTTVAALLYYYLRPPTAAGYAPAVVSAPSPSAPTSQRPVPPRASSLRPAGGGPAPARSARGSGLPTVGIDELAEDQRASAGRSAKPHR